MPHPVQQLGSLIIDYFRWSQLVPMIKIMVFLVSAWCLSIAHALGLLNRQVADTRLSEVGSENIPSIDDHWQNAIIWC